VFSQIFIAARLRPAGGRHQSEEEHHAANTSLTLRHLFSPVVVVKALFISVPAKFTLNPNFVPAPAGDQATMWLKTGYLLYCEFGI
jgi:hypothetical protein